MNPEVEAQLWKRFKEQGDDAAREELVIDYMRVVKYIAGRMAIHVPSSVELDDLISWGLLGLLDAVDRFDPEQNIKFSTYASIRIRGAIIDQIRSLDWAPRSLRAMARKIGASREKLRHEFGREPLTDEIAGDLGIEAAQVDDVMAQLQTAQVLALDDYIPSDAEGANRRLDVTADGSILSPEEKAEEEERIDRLVEAIRTLPDQQQKVLNLYYFEELTLKEIGAVLEVSESRICQVHSAAMKTLRKKMREED